MGMLAGVLALVSARADAVTLREALAQAYETNPQLGGGRAGVRALDEEIAVARALGRPSVDASAGLNQNGGEIGTLTGEGRNVSAGVDLAVPLFRGGLISSSVGAARARADAGRLDLDALENDIFNRTVTAYEDVRRDAEEVELNRNNVRVLTEQLRASRDRFEVGDLTRTDVAQSEARLADAQSRLRTAEAQLVRSEQDYAAVVGSPPIDLAPPPPLGELPVNPDQAIALARAENPSLLAARADARAAGFDIGIARSARRPSVFASGSVFYQNFLGTREQSLGLPSNSGLENDLSDQSVGLRLTLPLYAGGANSARVRQSEARRNQAELGVITTERSVVEQARTAYEDYVAAGAVIQSALSSVRANEIALEGVRAENSVGLRNILDVLDAEQELLNSRVLLVRARRNEYVAGFALLAAIGRATAEGLDLPVTPQWPSAPRAAPLSAPPAAR